jgi:sugar phosphate isomerase/epimerase
MLIERLKRLAPRAEAAGVTLALETELDADDHMRIVDAVASPAVKVYYDVRNMTDLGFDIYSEIPYLARKGALAQIHMKENGALLGHGVVDFVRVRKAVDEAEYRGWIVIESAVPPGAQIAPAYAHNARYLRTLFPEGADAPRGRMATPEFTIGFSERSLLRSIAAGTMTQLEIPAFAARELGTPELEHVSEAFPGGPEDTDHLRKLRHACEQNGVSSRVLTCREDLQLGAPDPDLRERAAAAYARWVDAAAALACPAVAVALESQGDWDQQVERAADGLRRLCEYAEEKGVSVLVENADGQSCNHAWLSEVLERTGKTNCGVLLDYAAFDGYNGPRAAAALAPRVRAVSAQARSFDGAGHETNTDFFAMTRTVLQGGYNGMVAIEYVGSGDEIQGIHRTRRLLELARVNPEGGPGGQAGPPPVVRVDFGDRGKWKIQAVDSQETSGEDGKAANILDGHEESFWHTEWSQKTPPHPHHVVVDLGEETDLVGVRYLGRQGAMSNGRIRDYEIYVSNHPEEWGKPVCEGHFENSPAEQHAQFGKARGRYLVVKALSEVNGNNWTTIAELGILTP